MVVGLQSWELLMQLLLSRRILAELSLRFGNDFILRTLDFIYIFINNHLHQLRAAFPQIQGRHLRFSCGAPSRSLIASSPSSVKAWSPPISHMRRPHAEFRVFVGRRRLIMEADQPLALGTFNVCLTLFRISFIVLSCFGYFC